MDIHHGLSGNRRVAAERGDHSRVVSERGGRGYYQQRPYGYRGHEYARRTYYDHGARLAIATTTRYPYHGMYLEGYAPAVYYAPAFYGWAAYNPWVAPVPYAWGFVAAPWYGYYGAVFHTVLPVYPSASLWLTDWPSFRRARSSEFFAAQQAAASQQQQAMALDAAPMTPDIKALVAEEVKRQLALANQEAQTTAANSVPDPASSGIASHDKPTTYNTYSSPAEISTSDRAGREPKCAVSEGDALQLTGPPAADATAASAGGSVEQAAAWNATRARRFPWR